jgi:phosphoinositide-3-kinase regulatory subunit 4
MISVDPSERPTFDTLLHTSRGTVFPESFYSFLHNYVSSLNEFSAETLNPSTSTPQATTPIQPSISTLSPPSTIRTTHSTNNTTTIGGTVNDGKNNDSLPSDSDHRLERIWLDYESIEPYISPEQQPHSSSDVDVKVEFTPQLNPTAKPFQVFLSCFSITFLLFTTFFSS